MNITGNTVLVAGGSNGIGRGIAEALHDRGNRVIVAGRRSGQMAEMARLRPGLSWLELDVTDPASVSRMARQLSEEFPQTNVVFANAGVSRTEDLTGSGWTAEAAQAVVETNILGVIRLIGALMPLLAAQDHATLVATGSALAFVPRADFPSYCASKAFLHSWLLSLRHQLRGHRIEVLELSPPYVQTSLTGEAQASDPRAMPLAGYVAAVMEKLEAGDHPNGEILLDVDLPRRHAERDGRFAEVFARLNPA